MFKKFTLPLEKNSGYIVWILMIQIVFEFKKTQLDFCGNFSNPDNLRLIIKNKKNLNNDFYLNKKYYLFNTV